MKKILITGIEGFVGSYLAEYLYSLNYQIAGIHIAKVKKSIGKLYKCDIRDYSKVSKVINKIKPDAIFHLAAQSSVFQGEKNIKDTFAINVQGTLNILEAVKEINIKPRIIYISSCEVYGRSNKKLTEQSPTNPMSFYAMSKLCAEDVCKYYERVYNLDIVILRPFSHTGPGQAEHFIFPRIARKVAEIEADLVRPILSLGNITVKRDYTDIKDIVSAYEMALNKCKRGEVYNITSGKVYSIKHGVDFLVSLSIRKIKVQIDKSLIRKNDLPFLSGSARKFIKQTNWQPKINFIATLTDLLDYYRVEISK